MKSMKIVISALSALIILLALAGCSPTSQPSSGSRSFTDGLGRTVSFEEVPAKVVSLSASNTEILFAIGAGGQVVGRDEFSDYPVEVKTIASVGGSMGKYDMEQIAALQPDLILAAEINTPEQLKAFEDLKIPVYYLSNPKDMDGLYANLTTVGQLTGHEKEAQALVESLQSRVETAMGAKKSGQPVKVFYELDGSDPSKPWTPGKGSYLDVLMALAGGENIGSTAGEGWVQISQEALIAANPEVILLGDAAYGITPEIVSQRAGWNETDAVKNNRIYPFDDNIVSRPGPRLVDGLEKLVEILAQ